MAGVSSFLPTFSSSSICCSRTNSNSNHSSIPAFQFQTHHHANSHHSNQLSMPKRNYNKFFPKLSTKIRSVAEEQTEVLGVDALTGEEILAPPEQPVSVPVSPSDLLTMSFQAEGTMDETAIDRVTKALEEQEGISDLKVQVLEGIASVQLKKQTTVQATGVSSGLVEIIQGSGFKLQTLNLSFDDEEEVV